MNEDTLELDDDHSSDSDEDEEESKNEEVEGAVTTSVTSPRRRRRELEQEADSSQSAWLAPWLSGESGRHLQPGNPHFSRRMQLYCRTGYHLAILKNGTVRGCNEDGNVLGMETVDIAELNFSSVTFGEVRIQGVASHLFLAMDVQGRLYGEVDKNEEATVFVETVIGQYNAYLSRKYVHLGWYVAIKKSGKPKRGQKTKWGQKAIQFLPKRTKS